MYVSICIDGVYICIEIEDIEIGIVYKYLFLKWGIVMVLDFFMFKFVYN